MIPNEGSSKGMTNIILLKYSTNVTKYFLRKCDKRLIFSQIISAVGLKKINLVFLSKLLSNPIV